MVLTIRTERHTGRTCAYPATGLAILLMGTLAGCFDPPGAASVLAGPSPSESVHSITVYGQGRAAAGATVVDITVEVDASAERLDDAYRICDNIVSRIVTAMTVQNEIGPADVRVVGHEMVPGVSVAGEDGGVTEGYLMRQVLAVTVRDMTRFSRVVQGILNHGPRRIAEVRFGLSYSKPLEARAREDAIVDARERARLMAHELGLRLGEVLSVRELPPAEVAALGDLRTGLMRPLEDTAPRSQYEIRSTVEVSFTLDPF